MLAWCLMLLLTYYAQNYASIVGTALVISQICQHFCRQSFLLYGVVYQHKFSWTPIYALIYQSIIILRKLQIEWKYNGFSYIYAKIQLSVSIIAFLLHKHHSHSYSNNHHHTANNCSSCTSICNAQEHVITKRKMHKYSPE